jgi:hypothetical protein
VDMEFTFATVWVPNLVAIRVTLRARRGDGFRIQDAERLD